MRRILAQSIGVSVSATNPEMTTAPATAMPNSLRSRPAVPRRNPNGVKTATSAMVVAITANPISFVPFVAASSGASCSSSWCRKAFSSTMMANAFRHQEELHEAPELAATNGTNEIGFAVIATTIALVAVFTPLGFLRGTAGRLLSEFGIAVAGAVVISGFVALTLTPMLCAKILRMSHSHGELFQMFERGFNALAERYAGLLRRAVDHRAVVLGGTLAVVALSG